MRSADINILVSNPAAEAYEDASRHAESSHSYATQSPQTGHESIATQGPRNVALTRAKKEYMKASGADEEYEELDSSMLLHHWPCCSSLNSIRLQAL
jgi:hypothetical protein